MTDHRPAIAPIDALDVQDRLLEVMHIALRWCERALPFVPTGEPMHIIKTISIAAVLAVFASTGWSATTVDAKEAASFATAPKAVQEAVRKQFAKGTVTECEQKKEDGIPMYKVTVTDEAGKQHKVTLSETGEVLQDKADKK
jgi:hypothetical protein